MTYPTIATGTPSADSGRGPGASSGQGRHLCETEFVDLLDGTLPADRKQHVDACDRCRTEADNLSLTWQQAAEGPVPELPSCFWEQFSAQIREAVAEEPVRRGRWWRAFHPTTARWAGLAAAAALVLALGLWRAAGSNTDESVSSAPAFPRTAVVAIDAGAGEDALDDVDADEDWALVRSIADGLPVDAIDAAGVVVRPGSAEGMALRLSDTERSELARLLEDEIKRGPLSESSS